MILEWLLTIGTSVSGWIADLFPIWNVPAALSSPQSAVASVMSNFVGLGSWVSWPILIGCVAAVLGTWLVMFTIKLIRAVIAHVPQFGGAG